MIASPHISPNSDHRTAQQVPPGPGSNALGSQPEPGGSRPAAHDAISPRQRWAHLLVLDIINANLPLARLADHLKIPFDTLITYINTPEVQAEIDAYEQLNNLRARLLGEAARPISLRKLLDVLESSAPRPTGRDPDADQRTLHRHAELIRRTATTIARESRALAPKSQRRVPAASSRSPSDSSLPSPTVHPAGVLHDLQPAASLKDDAASTASVSERTSAPFKGDPSNAAPEQPARPAPRRVPPVPAEHTSVSEAELVRDMSKPAPATPSHTPGREEAPTRSSETIALRAAAGSTHIVCNPSRRARDRPAA